MQKQDFYYELPQALIAQTPIEPRDHSRLLCYDRMTDVAKDLHFYDLAELLRAGDVLVLNNTRVFPARLYAYDEMGRHFEIFLLKRIDLTHWEVLLKPARKAKIGTKLTVNEELSLSVQSVEAGGVRTVSFAFNGVFEDILSRVGEVPLPPYIKEKLADKERYQTVYAKEEGSSAAPTAGLHFTEELLERLRKKGIEIVTVLLHVGLGTFRPVQTDNILEHEMHSEYFEVSEVAAATVNRAISENRRVIAVGTTSVRTLESVATDTGMIRAGKGNTNIFIYPGYRFKTVKGLITNFHLPESTLIMLVSAMIGREKTLELYAQAVEKGYRFFSFGDAMLIE